jgi:hypothetical protein
VIWLRPFVVAALGAGGVAIARHNPTPAPAIVGVAAALALVAVLFRERGGAVAALGVGAAAAFVSPDGLGPLLVATGVVLACGIAEADAPLARWRDEIDALVALPALAGLAATVAAQPSNRGLVVAVTAAAAVAGSAWRGRADGDATLATVGGLAAFVLMIAPDQLDFFGDLPPATAHGARSVASGLAVFALVAVISELPSRPRGSYRAPSG